MFKPNLILASTLTTLVIAGCADTNNSRVPQGKGPLSQRHPAPSCPPRRPLISQCD